MYQKLFVFLVSISFIGCDTADFQGGGTVKHRGESKATSADGKGISGSPDNANQTAGTSNDEDDSLPPVIRYNCRPFHPILCRPYLILQK